MKIAPIHATAAVARRAVARRLQRRRPQAAARAAAEQAAAKEQAAEAMAKQFDAAVTAQNWALAKGHGDVLQIEHPTSAAAARIKPKLDEIKARAEAEQQAQRLAALWTYGANRSARTATSCPRRSIRRNRSTPMAAARSRCD